MVDNTIFIEDLKRDIFGFMMSSKFNYRQYCILKLKMVLFDSFTKEQQLDIITEIRRDQKFFIKTIIRSE